MDHRTSDIGVRLRRAREERGLTLGDIANATKISIGALKALEENDVSRLPGGLFGRAYLKAFANEVGLNADELAREFRQTFEPEKPTTTPPGPPIPDRRSMLIWAASVAMTVILLLCGALVISALASHHRPQDNSPLRNELELAAPEAMAPREHLKEFLSRANENREHRQDTPHDYVRAIHGHS